MGGMPPFGPGGRVGTRRKHRRGCPLAPRNHACTLRRRRPAPRRNQRLLIPSGPIWVPGPGIPGPADTLFFKERKCYDFFNSRKIPGFPPARNYRLLANSPKFLPPKILKQLFPRDFGSGHPRFQSRGGWPLGRRKLFANPALIRYHEGRKRFAFFGGGRG
jgi:hypothetical protein